MYTYTTPFQAPSVLYNELKFFTFIPTHIESAFFVSLMPRMLRFYTVFFFTEVLYSLNEKGHHQPSGIKDCFFRCLPLTDQIHIL